MQRIFKDKLLNKIYKKSISLFIISLFIFSAFVSNYTSVRAQTTSTTCPAGQFYDSRLSSCVTDRGSNTVTNTNTGASSVANGKPSEPSKTFCDDIERWDIGKKAGCSVGYFILKIILEVTAKFAELTASMFDGAVNGYVLNIATLFKEGCDAKSGSSNTSSCIDKPWIYKSWSVIRDVTNILTVFSALYIGVRYIMGSEELDFRKSLIRILLAALLINFSFPLSKFAIDISNYVSVSVRSGIPGYVTSKDGSKTKVNGISGVIMHYTGVSTAIGNLANPGSDKEFKGFTSWTSMALAIVYLASVFFVFLYATLMILLRAIVLLVCVIFSPVMFMTSSFKSMEKLNQLWRDNFIGQLLFGPVFMLGLWLSIGFLASANSNFSFDGITKSVATPDSVQQTTMLVLSIISLFLAVFAANKVSSGLGGAIGGFIGGAVKTVGLGVATGGAGLALRGTAGRAGAAIAGSKWIKDKKENGGVIGRRIASGLSLAGDKMSNAKVTIGGKSSESTADKNKAVKEKLGGDHSKFLEENKGKLAANPALRDELYKARGDKDRFAIASAKLDPANAGKTDAQIKHSLGIVTADDKLATAARRAGNIDELRKNNVSSANTDAYLDAKKVSTRENRLAQVAAGRTNQMKKMDGELQKASSDSDFDKVASLSESKTQAQAQMDKNKARAEANLATMKENMVGTGNVDDYKDTAGFTERSVNDFKNDSKALAEGTANLFRLKRVQKENTPEQRDADSVPNATAEEMEIIRKVDAAKAAAAKA